MPKNSKSGVWGNITRILKNPIITHLATLVLGGTIAWIGKEFTTLYTQIASGKSKIRVAHSGIGRCLIDLYARLDSINTKLVELKNLGIISTDEYNDLVYRKEDISLEIDGLDSIFCIDESRYLSPDMSFFAIGDLHDMNNTLKAKYGADSVVTKQVVDSATVRVKFLSNKVAFLQGKKFRSRDKNIDRLRADIRQCNALLGKIRGTIRLLGSTDSDGAIEKEGKIRSLGNSRMPQARTIGDSVVARGKKSENQEVARMVSSTDLPPKYDNYADDGLEASTRHDLNTTTTEAAISSTKFNNVEVRGSVRTYYRIRLQPFCRRLEPELMAIRRELYVAQVEKTKRKLQNIAALEDSTASHLREYRSFMESLYQNN